MASGAVPRLRREPHDARARARGTDGGRTNTNTARTRKLRKGRDECSATRRDGEACEAPAVPGLLVCRRHGGATLAAQIAGQRLQLQIRSCAATREWLEARGTPAEYDALGRHGRALSELRYFEDRVAYLHRLSALTAELRATADPRDRLAALVRYRAETQACAGPHGSVPTRAREAA